MADSTSQTYTFVVNAPDDKESIDEKVKNAEMAYYSLPLDKHRLHARFLLLRLLDGQLLQQNAVLLQRRRVFEMELQVPDSDEAAVLDEVIDAFVDAELLDVDTMHEKRYIEVSDEELLQSWPRLHTWVQEEGLETLRSQHQLIIDALDWDLHGRPTQKLYRGKDLTEACAVVKRMIMSETEYMFMKESMKAQGKQFNWEIAKVFAIGAGIVGTLVATFKNMKDGARLKRVARWRNRNSRKVKKLKRVLRRRS